MTNAVEKITPINLFTPNSTFVGSNLSNIFDGDATTFWGINASDTTSHYLLLELNKITKLKELKITPVYDSAGSSVKDFNVYLGNINSFNVTDFNLVYSGTEANDETTKSHIITNDSTGKYILINFLTNYRTGNVGARTALRELEIYGTNFNKTLILSQNEYKKFIIHPSHTEGVSLVPALTSNTSSSIGYATSSSNVATGYEAYKAFNKLNVGVNGEDAFATSGSDAILTFNFYNKKVVKSYKLTSYNSTIQTQSPKSWRLEGLDDLGNWVILDSQDSQTWTKALTKEFAINNTQAFIAYRLKVTNNNGGVTTIIGELELISGKYDGEFTIKTISTNTPTQEQFLTEGMDSLSPLLDRRVETLEPLPMTEDSTQMESGKLFSKTINLKKYVDIRSVKVDVK